MRLANTKTKNETGFDHVLQNLNVRTPFGKKALKEILPFFPGDEEKLNEEFHKVDMVLDLLKEFPRKADMLNEVFMELKDITFTITRSSNNVLTVVELFEIKNLLIQMMQISQITRDIRHFIPKEFLLSETLPLLDSLDPRKDRISTFYIYDEFSAKLADCRKEKRELELEIRRQQKIIKQQLEQDHGLCLTPKFELLLSKSNSEALEKVKAIPQLVLDSEDYMTATYTLKSNEAIFASRKKMEQLNERIEDEELTIRTDLSAKVATSSEALIQNCKRIGALDLVLAKAFYAKEHQCIKPEITTLHLLEIEEGKHLQVEEILKMKKKTFCPISIKLQDGVTCITGANMGGKTVSLKLIGLIALLVQHGFFAPCSAAKMGLSSYIHILIGDTQSMQRGLSSFGSEMEELKDILDQSKDNALILIDEIASGTNPIEGLALTKSVVNYLNARKYITVLTTHFDNVAVGSSVQNMQVRGLAGANIEKLIKELKYGNRRERIEILAKYMDYRLYGVGPGEEIPKDALNIAKMLGIYDEIIQEAQKILIEGGK